MAMLYFAIDDIFSRKFILFLLNFLKIIKLFITVI